MNYIRRQTDHNKNDVTWKIMGVVPIKKEEKLKSEKRTNVQESTEMVCARREKN